MSITLRARAATGALAATMLAVLASGCGGHGEAPQDTDVQDFATQVEEAIAAAEAGGAGQSQLEILRDAQAAGDLSYAQAHEAVAADMECYAAGGGTAEFYEQTEDSGLVIPGYMAVAKDDATLAKFEPVMDECSKRESFWVNKLYQLQPGSQQTRDAYLETQAPVIRACLEDRGYATDPAATPQELVSLALEVSRESDGAVTCYP